MAGTATLSDSSTYEESAAVLRSFVKSGFLTVPDLLRASPRKLFMLHREYAHDLGMPVEGGLAVRTTVQFNLFAGSVANLGSPAQREWLAGVLARGELGCFALTESGAGVLSGLVVETTARWTAAGYRFESPAPLDRSRKVWISQGLTARWAVVIARLLLPDADRGPHAFIVDLTAPGIVREDMAKKTAYNGLDNAYIYFAEGGAMLPHSTLLSGISSVSADGAYVLADPKVPFKFEHVAQRLLSGRVCIAAAALGRLNNTLVAVKSYAQTRHMPMGPGQTVPLAELPCFADAVREIEDLSCALHCYVCVLERDFATAPELTPALVHRIACAKIVNVQHALDATIVLKERVGAFSLMRAGPFGLVSDLLYVFRFAEGDSAVLCQKMVRDALRPIASPMGLLKTAASLLPLWLWGGRAAVQASVNLDLLRLALSLRGLKGDAMMRTWLASHARVESIARRMAALTIAHDIAPLMDGTRQMAAFDRAKFQL